MLASATSKTTEQQDFEQDRSKIKTRQQTDFCRQIYRFGCRQKLLVPIGIRFTDRAAHRCAPSNQIESANIEPANTEPANVATTTTIIAATGQATENGR